MKIVVQRVSCASVEVNAEIIAQIKQGFLLFVGIAADDTSMQARALAEKVLKLRVFEKEGRIDKSVVDKDYEILVVSQFTLLADTKKGNRPSFIKAAPPAKAEVLYEDFIQYCQKSYKKDKIQSGKFGADMKVSLQNDGPFTLIVSSSES
jgi:D-aminoacyl-tRNA deacylase